VCKAVVVIGGSADLGMGDGGWGMGDGGWGSVDRIGGVGLRGLGLGRFAPRLLRLDGVCGLWRR